jgi:hypothetical protein
MPIPNDRPDVQGRVIADIAARRSVGIERYGTPLQPFNGRDALRDAYEEALDLACYLRQALEERKAETDRIAVLEGELRDYERSMARANEEIRRLAAFKETLERVALAAGCLPTEFPDAYGHVIERVQRLRETVADREDGHQAFRIKEEDEKPHGEGSYVTLDIQWPAEANLPRRGEPSVQDQGYVDPDLRQPFHRTCILAAARHLDLRGIASTFEEVAKLAQRKPLADGESVVFEEVHAVVGDGRCIAFVFTEPELARLVAAGGRFV